MDVPKDLNRYAGSGCGAGAAATATVIRELVATAAAAAAADAAAADAAAADAAAACSWGGSCCQRIAAIGCTWFHNRNRNLVLNFQIRSPPASCRSCARGQMKVNFHQNQTQTQY